MDRSIDLFCSILSRETGLDFPPSKYSFIQNRLSPILEKYKCSNPSELILKSKFDIKIKIDIVNALTTNETWFFRHSEHFEILKKIVFPEIIKRKKDKSIRIWSAGCSTGAELYSILITLFESIPNYNEYRISVLGSDISYDSILKAKNAIYTIRDLKETEEYIKNKYFDMQEDGNYKIKEELRRYAYFEYLNLLETWPPRTFDIIFCRNTMIYFKEEAKDSIIKRFFKALDFNGYFFTSANEQINILNENYGINKLYIKNEYIYQKTTVKTGSCELFFKDSTDLLRATNLLRKCCYNFQFGSSVKDGFKNIRNLIISSNDCDKIVKLLLSNSIVPSKRIITFR